MIHVRLPLAQPTFNDLKLNKAKALFNWIT